MDFQIDNTGLTFNKNVDIRTDVYTSLNVAQGTFFQNPGFGSKLTQVKKVTANNLLLAQQYVQNALQWLLQTGRATQISSIVEKDDNDFNRLNIKVTIVQANGVLLYYQQFFDVKSGKITWASVGGPSSTWTSP